MFGSRSLKSLSVSTILAGSLMLGGAGATLAQDAETTTGPAYPAHIHAGTCDDLEPNPLEGLNDVTPWINEDTDDESANEHQGVLTAPEVNRSETDVELPLEDILAQPHSINVHESADNIENYIACGEIGGIVVADDGDDTLVVALRSLNDSGYHGLAFLEANGDTTTVRLWLAEPYTADEEGEPTPTPEEEATPEG